MSYQKTNPTKPQALGNMYVHISQLFLFILYSFVKYWCFKFNKMNLLSAF